MICKSLDLSDESALFQLLAEYPQLNWTPSMLKDSLNAPQNEFFGLFDHEVLVSFCLFQVVLKEAELLLILTHPQHLKQGYATHLLHKTLGRFESVFLEVRVSNDGARQLYEKLGFEYQGSRKNYYANPSEDAAIYHCIPINR